MNISLYKTFNEKENKTISFENYVELVRLGTNEDAVIAGRLAKQKGDKELYKRIKSNSQLVTSRGTIPNGESKTNANLVPCGLVDIDVDEELTLEQKHQISNDPYVVCFHDSFGGEGSVIWFKINPEKIDDAYKCISKYIYNTYGILADPACSNRSRLRYLSMDSNIIYNPKAKLFNVKVEKKDQKPKHLNFIHSSSDFDNIIEQIIDRKIDLVKGDYTRYIRIGFALYDQFGDSGERYFEIVNEFNPNQNKKRANQEWKALCKKGECGIGTFYHYCKEEGIELYSDKTKQLINRVKIGKTQGSPTVESVEKNMDALGYELDEDDRKITQQLIDSKEDFSHLANEDLTELEQIGNFIRDAFQPTKDELTNYRYVNGERMEDDMINDIHIVCDRNFKDFKVKKEDVKTVLYSNLYVNKFNLLKDFIRDHKDIKTNNAIERVVDCLNLEESTTREFALWAFKKWIVGAMHNWIADFNEKKVCPLVFVLCSNRMGAGKTIFFRELMPKFLEDYFLEGKIDVSNKDSKLRIARSLVLCDNEFGGKSIKENEQFKDMTDYNIIVDRVAYGREDSVFKRRAILAGTSNEYNLLKDFTGKQRRILPINITSLDYDKYMAIDKEELIMEAYNLLKSDFEWNIWREEDVNYLYENTQSNLDQMPVDDIFKINFSFVQDEEHTEELVWNQGEIIDFFANYSNHKFTRFDVKNIMDKNFQRLKTHRFKGVNKKGYKFYVKQNVAGIEYLLPF